MEKAKEGECDGGFVFSSIRQWDRIGIAFDALGSEKKKYF